MREVRYRRRVIFREAEKERVSRIIEREGEGIVNEEGRKR